MSDDFQGIIGDTWRESSPWWPPTTEPPPGAPNVLLIVLDDVGFAQLGCYGSDIATPTIDGLAASGVRLANFHTTALCSPTRSCLLTGRNHHSNAMARVADLATGFPGYYGRIPRTNGFLSEILNSHGYASYAVGKWHLTPEDETHMAAPRNTWPVGRGFQRWYGFHGGETHQFVPTLYHDNHSVAPPRSVDDGYHLSEDLADRAIEYLADLRAVDADQPFFLYLCPGACHSPHHAPRAWIERYAGHFDRGWDAWRDDVYARQLELGLLPPGTELTARPPWVPAWDELNEQDQRVAARFMECFAAFLSYTDAQLGRVLAFLEALDELDDTLVILVSDNGASSEGGARGSINDARLWNGMPAGRKELRQRIDEIGGPTAHNNYPWGWTMAGNTPFKRWKREVHEGGVADPCIIRWPGRVGAGGAIRHQFTHAIDIAPTVLELLGIAAPDELAEVAQSPIEGISFAYLLRDDGDDAPERHQTQYFEMLGCRGIYHRGYKAVTFKPAGALYDDGIDPDALFDDDRWELYDKRNDFSECHDIAEQFPDILRELVDQWWTEARKYKVLPLDNRPLAALENPRPRPGDGRTRFVYFPNTAPVPEPVAPNVRNRDHSITAYVDVAADGPPPQGVLLALGSVLGGFTLYLLDGVLHYVHNLTGRAQHRIVADFAVSPGSHELRFDFTARGDFTGTARLSIDGKLAGAGEIPMFTPARFSITGSGLTCGYERGPAVSNDYAAPFPCTATIRKVVVDVTGVAYRDLAAEFEALMSEQ